MSRWNHLAMTSATAQETQAIKIRYRPIYSKSSQLVDCNIIDSGGWVTSWVENDRFHLLLKGVCAHTCTHIATIKRGMRFIHTSKLSSGEISFGKGPQQWSIMRHAKSSSTCSLPGAEMAWFFLTFSLRWTSEIEQQYNSRHIIFATKKRIKEIS